MPVVNPTAIGLEAASICQLRCPSCPTPSGQRRAIAPGVLRLRDFEGLLAANELRHVELANFGEIFLNQELPRILACAHERGVATSAAAGTNFNHVSAAALEALVRYQLRELTCSIDGASPETYARYRVRGDFDRVMQNLERLNARKARHRSVRPRLTWQFIAFGHNEHEILAARARARKLGMRFYLKLSWDERVSPVRARELVARLSGLGVATRSEYLRRHGRHPMRQVCLQLWHAPQFNWDGTSLGCCHNVWADFGGNLFRDGLLATVNSEKMAYAREMLLGRVPARAGIPCTTCVLYQVLRANGDWHDEAEIRRRRASSASPRGVIGAARRIAATAPRRG
jgi:hypothetical protein